MIRKVVWSPVGYISYGVFRAYVVWGALKMTDLTMTYVTLKDQISELDIDGPDTDGPPPMNEERFFTGTTAQNGSSVYQTSNRWIRIVRRENLKVDIISRHTTEQLLETAV